MIIRIYWNIKNYWNPVSLAYSYNYKIDNFNNQQGIIYEKNFWMIIRSYINKWLYKKKKFIFKL